MRDRWQRGNKWFKLSSVETIALEQLKQSTTSRETKEEMDDNLETKGNWLPDDLLFKVFLLLPAETLCGLRCVCKSLLNMINSPAFVEAHFHQSEMVLITENSFHKEIVRTPFPLPSDKNECYFQSWDIHSGKGHKACMPDNLRNIKCILAACNGLVLAEIRRNGGLVVINPSTRNHTRVPLGTICCVQECYGFMFSHFTGAYKVVHLFRDTSRNILCEILNLTTRSWHAVDGPNSEKFGSIKTHRSVSAVGALYWLPQIEGCNHIVSLGFHDEKFLTVPLPISSTKNDRLVEIGGSLSFVTHATLNLIQVWILNSGNWLKRYSINRLYDITGFVPLCASIKEIFFQRGGYPLLHIYNFEAEEMQEVGFEGTNRVEDLYMPIVKSLISWDM